MDKDVLSALPEHSISTLASVLNRNAPPYTDSFAKRSVFWAATKCVAEAAFIEINQAPPLSQASSTADNLEQLAHAYSFRYRQVNLTGSWWSVDHGPLLVFQKSDLRPCALIPGKKGRYQLVNFTDQNQPVSLPLNEKSAATLDTGAYSLYRSLPDKNIKWRDLLSFGIKDLRKEICLLLFASAAVALLSLLVPIASQVLIDQIIPSADISLLQQLIIALICNTLAITLFSAASTIASMRLQLKMNVSLQAALWDRLLRLPVNFFSGFSVGDLANRAGSIDSIQQTLTGNVISTFINGLFSLFTLALMAYYDWRLALAGVALTLIFCSVNVLTTLLQLKYQRHMYQAQGKLMGVVLQFLNNITKLRIANKESTAFAIWANQFTQTNRLFLKSESIHIRLKVFSALFPVLSTTLIYFMVVKLGSQMSFGNFIGFNSAYGQFFAALIGLADVVAGSLSIIPLYERATPILSTLPEDQSADINLDQLHGEIALKNISFHYRQDNKISHEKQLPWIFNDISLQINPGELIALVGPSGCGKSSLFRLLLGFETAQYGAIYFDGHKLDGVNHHAMRKQIGVVLQNSSLLPGSIMENILSGSAIYTEENAWEAATHACIKQDIEAMPMGMHTIVAEGGNNLSKGQQQRLLIAQALAKKPKLLFFDEATSALDNATQATITRYLEKLNITCVLAAHRLSTIANADRIYVFDQAKVIQQGTFQELAGESGLFAQMMAHQMIEKKRGI